MDEITDALRECVLQRFSLPEHSVHGPAHWRRVERNGLLLARTSGADVVVVRLFALFHDCCRENDGWDDYHGARGAAYAGHLRGRLFDVSEARFDLLCRACIGHTGSLRHEDPTIGTCWDADRLDLGRVGVAPKSRYMSTARGRELAEGGAPWPVADAADAF